MKPTIETSPKDLIPNIKNSTGMSSYTHIKKIPPKRLEKLKNRFSTPDKDNNRYQTKRSLRGLKQVFERVSEPARNVVKRQKSVIRPRNLNSHISNSRDSSRHKTPTIASTELYCTQKDSFGLKIHEMTRNYKGTQIGPKKAEKTSLSRLLHARPSSKSKLDSQAILEKAKSTLMNKSKNITQRRRKILERKKKASGHHSTLEGSKNMRVSQKSAKNGSRKSKNSQKKLIKKIITSSKTRPWRDNQRSSKSIKTFTRRKSGAKSMENSKNANPSIPKMSSTQRLSNTKKSQGTVLYTKEFTTDSEAYKRIDRKCDMMLQRLDKISSISKSLKRSSREDHSLVMRSMHHSNDKYMASSTRLSNSRHSAGITNKTNNSVERVSKVSQEFVDGKSEQEGYQTALEGSKAVGKALRVGNLTEPRNYQVSGSQQAIQMKKSLTSNPVYKGRVRPQQDVRSIPKYPPKSPKTMFMAENIAKLIKDQQNLTSGPRQGARSSLIQIEQNEEAQKSLQDPKNSQTAASDRVLTKTPSEDKTGFMTPKSAKMRASYDNQNPSDAQAEDSELPSKHPVSQTTEIYLSPNTSLNYQNQSMRVSGNVQVTSSNPRDQIRPHPAGKTLTQLQYGQKFLKTTQRGEGQNPAFPGVNQVANYFPRDKYITIDEAERRFMGLERQLGEKEEYILKLENENEDLKRDLKKLQKHLKNFLLSKNREISGLKENMVKAERMMLGFQDENRKLKKLMNYYGSDQSIIKQSSKESSSVFLSTLGVEEAAGGAPTNEEQANLERVDPETILNELKPNFGKKDVISFENILRPSETIYGAESAEVRHYIPGVGRLEVESEGQSQQKISTPRMYLETGGSTENLHVGQQGPQSDGTVFYFKNENMLPPVPPPVDEQIDLDCDGNLGVVLPSNLGGEADDGLLGGDEDGGKVLEVNKVANAQNKAKEDQAQNLEPIDQKQILYYDSLTEEDLDQSQEGEEKE